MASLKEAFRTLYPRWRDDIQFFTHRVMQVTPSDQQAELLDQIEGFTLGKPDYKRHIAIRSAQGCGKTVATTIGMLWRTWRHLNTPGYTTAPTMRQATTVWMGELRRRVTNAHPLVNHLVQVDMKKAIINKMQGWGIEAVTASKPENMQGLHHPHMTILVEEASGIGFDIMEVIEGTSSEDDNMVILIGNPNSKASPLYPPFTSQRSKWACMHWSGPDSPYVTEENLEYLRDKYGEDSDVYRVRGLGEWPLDDPGIILNLDDIEACTKTDMTDMSQANDEQAFGIDLAAFGGDETVVIQRAGNAVLYMKGMSHVDPSEALDWASLQMHDFSWKPEDTWFVVDAVGIGEGVIGTYKRHGLHVHPFKTNNNAFKSDIYANKMTEAWFGLRDLVKRRSCHLPNDTRLIEQLSTRMYLYDNKNRLLVEPKKDYQKRTMLESPDRADAVVMAFYNKHLIDAKIASGKRSRTVGSRVHRRR